MHSEKYQLIQKLATGGMAEVFLAKSAGPMGFEKSLVVKRILPHLATESSFVDMFLSEARLAAQLNHPNIVQIFDFGEADGTYFIAMEYIDGVNLREVIRRAGAVGLVLPLAFCARVISAACEGLAFAHDCIDPATNLPMNIIHRDISPDNILLSRQGSVKVVDFGIAKAAGVSPHTQTGVLKGKLAYMPPEQLRNEPLDRRADVYALGIVLYELLTGFKPFRASSEAALLQAILSEPEVPVEQRRSDVPETLQRILSRAISKDREKRYPDCPSFQADLEAFIVEFIVSTGKPMGASQMAGIVAMMATAESVSPSPQKTTSLPRSPSKLIQSQPQPESSSAAAVRPVTDLAPLQEVLQPEVHGPRDERTTVARPSRLSPKVPHPHDKETAWVALVGVLLILIGGGYLSRRLLAGGPPREPVSLAPAGPTVSVSVMAPGEAHGGEALPATTPQASDGGTSSPALKDVLSSSGTDEHSQSIASAGMDVSQPPGPVLRDAGVAASGRGSSSRGEVKPPEKPRTQAVVVGQGSLDLLVVPEAMLFLNGWQMGLTRKASFPLDAGKYTLKLVNSKLQKKVEREILVTAGQTTQIDINLLEQ
ncbi:serine/threonine protein kinase [Hyalangium minutum]|uniref:Serine/threonine protein kinase PrkC, regulator of stationary phase n=1 Tax=Hyalangium minutum TaxID=394096 RepID=A0A085WU31_9BACT|nr:serine/threonine-protein kinase [Hyalangium minutum]KFE71194.1 Serine/threonine protein kinase PrkC, regulator of stationary phase [Hyalangium minutum]